MLDPRQTVATIVLDHPETAAVFHRHRIDFCCRGDLSVADACAERDVPTQTVLEALAAAIQARGGEPHADPRARSTPSLIAHIVSTHHDYLRDVLPFLRGLSEKVRRVHGEHDPRLHELDTTVRELAEALVPHLDTEEQVLFPALSGRTLDPVLVARELETMREEHLAVGHLLERIRDVSEEYRLPEWACNSYRTLFAELRRLESDTLRHVHLENHVLGPRFAAAEQAT